MELAWILAMSPGAAPAASEDEAALIRASLKGDGGAFSGLVRLHQHRVFRLAGRFFRRREDVEEAAQDTFLTAWRNLASYKAKAPFEHWLTRVCLNCCYARLKRARHLEEPLGRVDPESPSPHPEAALEVERLLTHLAPADRFILLMLEGEGWSVSEIARRLGWTVTNVKVRAHRARRKLKRLLEPSP